MTLNFFKFFKRQKKTIDLLDQHFTFFFQKSSFIFNTFYSQIIFSLSDSKENANSAIFNSFYNTFSRQRYEKSVNVFKLFKFKKVFKSFTTSFNINCCDSLNLLRQKHINVSLTFSNFSKSINFVCIRQRIKAFCAYEKRFVEKYIYCFCEIFIFLNEVIFLNVNDFSLSILNNRMNFYAFKNNN
jgi:hypothetical protein